MAIINLPLTCRAVTCTHYSSFFAHLQNKEKEIAVTLKWNLNAVTAADFVEELSRRLAVHIPAGTLEKLVEHSHTLASNALLCKWSDPPPDSSQINPVACTTTNTALCWAESVVTLSLSPPLPADLSFAKVPPSLLACACLSDALQHMAGDHYPHCFEMLAQLCGVDQVCLCMHPSSETVHAL